MNLPLKLFIIGCAVGGLITHFIIDKPVRISETVYDTTFVRLIDTIRVESIDTLYIETIVPSTITEEGVASFDTTLQFEEDKFRLGVSLSLSFDLRDTVFRDLNMSLYDVEFMLDTVVTVIEKTNIVVMKPSRMNAVKYALIGTAVGIMAWSLLSRR